MKINLSKWRGEWALVTGASCGLGLEFCRQLAASGLNLVMVARRDEVLASEAKAIASTSGVKCLPISCDLSESASLHSIPVRLREEGIRPRLLVNNAGSGKWGVFENADVIDIERMVGLNALAPVALCRLLAEELAAWEEGAAVINVSSPAVFQPVPYMAAYAASKSALHQFSLALSEEWRPKGILVQTLVPGPTATEFDHRAGAYGSGLGSERASPEVVVKASLAALASGRILVVTAPGVLGQKIFSTFFPVAFVLKKVADMFRPPQAGS